MTSTWKEHPDSVALQKRMTRCRLLATPLKATIYRVTHMRYANQADLLTGVGARTHGGRWNPPQRFCAVYGSLLPFTALAESMATGGQFGVPLEQRMPLVLVAIEIDLSAMLDLSAGKVRRILAVSQARMLSADWEQSQMASQEALPQAIGRIAHQQGLEAIVVPSAASKKEKNIVIFPERKWPTSRIEIVNREELPTQRLASSS